MPGQLLWDVGAASGSIGIEWLRAEPSARAIAIEVRPDRARQAVANALRLGVPELDVRDGHAPQALAGLPRPDAVFVGGGLTTPGLVEACWGALRPGGRIVANVVTLEGEQALVAARAAHGGQLARIEIAHAERLGAFTGWRAQLPVVQWSAGKP
jgi:precorrin-6Y C5,15-methyltransferase (decarboxylating)